MKIVVVAVCLSLSSVVGAAQGRGAAVRAQAAKVRNEKLVSCVRGGDADCVARALAEGADANAVDDEGVAVLIHAAEGRSARVVSLLLAAGADANKARPGEGTPLCRAALFGRREIAEALLEKGAKVNVVCDADHGDSPLMDALRGAMLGAMPGDLREELVGVVGVSSEKAEAAEAAGRAGEEDVRLREALKAPPEEFLAIARLLLARGADVNVVAKCDAGETALMYAAMSASVELVKELLARGADVKRGAPALTMLQATEFLDEKVRRLALPALSKFQGAMLAWSQETAPARAEIKRLLKAAGAKEVSVEEGSKEAWEDEEDLKAAATEAFSDAIEQDDVADFTRLADAYAAHPLGAHALPEALRLAVIFKRTAMIKILLGRGVSPNPGDWSPRGQTPLMQAVHDGHVEYVRMLLEAGADVNASDKDGRTALDAAESRAGSSEEHRAIIKLLLARGAKSGQQNESREP